jgi:23S rRNA pseudouridine955/2504/2580 synthase/23S rRNA pseudouridine1911/1915/1917 synthase
MKQKIEIIYQDDDIIVVNKPAPFLSIADRYAPEKYNLQEYLSQKFGNVFVVHRLDKETSGVMIFAKNENAHANLSAQFEKREVTKIYWALVMGRMSQESGIIDKPIAHSQSGVHRMVINPKGKPSETHYKTLEYFKNYTLVEVDLKTGRTHQIRVHFDAIGYPLAIDALYAKKTEFLLSQVKTKKYRIGKNQEERPLMTRHTLHSRKLVITHPTSNNEMIFEAELPKDFRAVLSQLRKWGI